MKIKSLYMKNIKLFNDFTLSFIDDNTNTPHNVILIVGENGTGKTTILKAIVSCLTTNNRLYGGEVFNYEDVTNNADIGSITIKTIMNERELNYFGDSVKTYDFHQYIVKKDGIEIDGNILQKTNRELLIKRDNHVVSNSYNSNSVSFFSRETYDGSLVLYFDVFRLIPKIQINGPDISNLPKLSKERALTPSIQKQYGNDRFYYTKQWLVNLDYKEDKTYRQTGQDSGLMKEVINAFNILLAPYEFSRITYESKIMFKTPNGEVDIDDLSDGLKSVFSIIGEMLFRFSMPYMNQDFINTKLILETEAVVLIDEIDCHLHPRWQLSILPSLRKLFPNVQFIITTHAPLVVSSVYPDEIYQLGEVFQDE